MTELKELKEARMLRLKKGAVLPSNDNRFDNTDGRLAMRFVILSECPFDVRREKLIDSTGYIPTCNEEGLSVTTIAPFAYTDGSGKLGLRGSYMHLSDKDLELFEIED